MDAPRSGVNAFSKRWMDVETLSNSFVRRSYVKRQDEFVDELSSVRPDDSRP